MDQEPVLNPEDLKFLIKMLFDPKQLENINTNRSATISYTLERKFRFRVNAFFQKGQLSITCKVVPQTILDLNNIGLSPGAIKLADASVGLVLVAGPGLSGRTTTVASMLKHINSTRTSYILTIEEPIEYVMTSSRSIVEQREVGKDTESFERAAQNLIEEDAKIVFVSELKTPEMHERVLELVQSGRLVFAIVDGLGAVDVLETFVANCSPEKHSWARRLLPQFLNAVVVQRLMPRAGGGQVLAHELLLITPGVRTAMRDQTGYASLQHIIQTAKADGMHTIDQSIADLVRGGLVFDQQARGQMRSPQALDSLLRNTN